MTERDEEGVRGRLQRVLADEERAGLALALKGRLASLVLIAVLVATLTPWPGVLYYHALLGLFAAVGVLDLWLARTGRRLAWHGYLFAAIDFSLMAFALTVPNPFDPFDYGAAFGYRNGGFIYFFVILCGLAFSYRPRLLIFGGVAGALAWWVGVLWVMSLPGTTWREPPTQDPAAHLAALLAPDYVNRGVRVQEAAVFLIVVGLLALIVERSRRLVLRQAGAERARANLARHFAPTMVDRLAETDNPLGEVQERPVAVLFADVAGFTRWSEGRPPAEVIAFLRRLHAGLERAVFDHHGTLDKFMGDGIMATFGTPEPSERDPLNAIASARAMLAFADTWSAERVAAGAAPVRLCVGVHYGPVVMGDVGSERRLEYAVLGDTVNVASRLEAMTRTLGVRGVISAALADAARAAAQEEAAAILAPFQPGGTVEVRGRGGTLDVLVI